MNRNDLLYRDPGGFCGDEEPFHHISEDPPIPYQHDAPVEHILVPVEGVRIQPDKHGDVDQEQDDVYDGPTPKSHPAHLGAGVVVTTSE